MTIENISNLLVNNSILVILSTLWLTYSYIVLKAGFVSDDLMGIEQYDGSLKYPVELENGDVKRDQKGEIVKGYKISYGTLSKFVRYHICGGNFPSRKRYPTKPDGTLGDFIPSGKIPSHHHVLSLVLNSIACVLLYHFLLTLTSPTIALMAVCLFIVHPVCLQAVAWNSAIGYILSLICITASLNIANWMASHTSLNHTLIGLLGLVFFQVWGVYAQAIPMFTWVILLVLGQWQLAIVCLLASGAASAVNLREYVLYRKKEFKKQKMEASTSFNIRKPIVALKTIAYYFYLCLFPSRMGLYHEWGFHYDKRIELWDWRAITGLILTGLSAYLFLSTGSMAIKVSIVWFYAFLLLFLNWITAQQWVTERYAYIPVIGLCLLASIFLEAFIPIYFLIFGLLLSRTLCHMPTYDNELRFYLSNTWNFPRSEVAYGNLGVTYSMAGLGGAASDMWKISSSLNTDYDVPFYNIFSKMRSEALMLIQHGAYDQGMAMLKNCLPIIEKTLKCKVLHFPEQWKKESEEVRSMITNPVNFLIGEFNRLKILSNKLNQEFLASTDDKRKQELIPSIQNNDRQIDLLQKFLAQKGARIEYDSEKAILSKLSQTQRSENGSSK